VEKKYKTFKEFYPFYLSQHQTRACRVLHFTGALAGLGLLFFAIYSNNYLYLLGAPFLSYTLAWFGHFIFEKNKPATFKYPLFSLIGDFVMFKDILFGEIKLSK